MRVAIILNPVAGVPGPPERARRRAELAMDLLASAGADAEVLVTEHAGHARALAAAAVARGAHVVVAWGGDGTVNEVASALVRGSASLAIIPAGSGNGLARMLGMPSSAAAAIRRVLHGTDRLIDVGTIDGRLFVNVAGVGFDAHIAAEFAGVGRARRGFIRYGSIVLRELRTYGGRRYRLTLDESPEAEHDAFLLSFANGRQWGNGAVIAPAAELDDGALDAVVISSRTPGAALWAIPRLFRGTLDRAAGVTVARVKAATVCADRPLAFHADGESYVGGHSLSVRVMPGVLRLRS